MELRDEFVRFLGIRDASVCSYLGLYFFDGIFRKYYFGVCHMLIFDRKQCGVLLGLSSPIITENFRSANVIFFYIETRCSSSL